MKAKELKALSELDLSKKTQELRKELVKLRAQSRTGTTLKNPLQIRMLKRTLARILTINNQRRNTKQ
ncbi:50S ribosomal protein L29 [Candidatus Woesearchaeota archaeon]|nr:50S ribosomal protein L29 [Candidatus Woesearchaeota archaeon]